MSKEKLSILGRNIFEVRYDPIISFFDWKGALAEHLIEEMGFEGFKISQDRIDLTNPDEQDFLIFVTIHSAGLVLENNNDSEIIKERIDNFLSALEKFNKFSPKKIVRIGARWNLLSPIRNTNFSQIKKTFTDHIVQLNKSPYGEYIEDLIDIGLPLNFKGKEYNYNILHGPMKQEQALSLYFNNKIVYFDNLGNPKNIIPKQGFFFDIDVFKTELGEINMDKIKEISKQFVDTGKKKFNLINTDFLNHIK